MPMLDELLRSKATPGAPGSSPELEQMLGRITQLQDPQGTPGGMMPANPSQGGGPRGVPTMQGTPAAPMQAGSAQGMAPEQANLTYQMLIKAGVPPEIAKQAIAEPKFLQEILVELQKQQLGAPRQAPLVAPGGQAAGTPPQQMPPRG